MRAQPKIRIHNHVAGRDASENSMEIIQAFLRKKRKVNSVLSDIQSIAGQLPSQIVLRENLSEARQGLQQLRVAINRALSALDE